MVRTKVLVIGAGSAGLVALKTLRESGVDAVAFEGGRRVGGIWVFENDNGLSSAYRTLHINTDRKRTAFAGAPFPRNIQYYPTHWEMAQYFADYADKYDLWPHVRFGVWVDHVERAEGSESGWVVTTKDGEKHRFDNIVIATGHLSVPSHPDAIKDAFSCEYLHSHYYRSPDPYVGKRVCVIGVGNSAADISTDICNVTESTVMVARSGVLIRPKFAFGVPYPDIMLALQKPWIPGRVRGLVNALLCYLIHGKMERLGFVKLTEKAHPTSSATLVNHILYNRVRVKNGIEKIDGSTIHFTDGSSEIFDVLIAATGYKIDVPFLRDHLTVESNRLELWKRIVHPDLPGIFFQGFANASDLPLNYMFERQAEWITQFVVGNATLPPAEEMRQDILRKRAEIDAVYRHTPRHTIDEEMLPYTAELRRSLATSLNENRLPAHAARRMRAKLRSRKIGKLF